MNLLLLGMVVVKLWLMVLNVGGVVIVFVVRSLAANTVQDLVQPGADVLAVSVARAAPLVVDGVSLLGDPEVVRSIVGCHCVVTPEVVRSIVE